MLNEIAMASCHGRFPGGWDDLHTNMVVDMCECVHKCSLQPGKLCSEFKTADLVECEGNLGGPSQSDRCLHSPSLVSYSS